MKIWNILILIIFSISFSYGQSTINGKLIDEYGEGLIGATVQIKNSNKGAITNYDGTFSLAIKSFPTTLVFSYVGYEEKELIINSNETIIVVLEEIKDIGGCPPIIVIDKRLLYSANYANIESKDLKLNTSTTVLSGMDLAPGVHIQSGALNTNRITIRGIGNRSQFTTAKIRAYLDGIPLTSGVGETSLEDIDVDMLSSIQIVKGPNVSNYGSGLGGSIIMNSNGGDKRRFASSKFETGSYGLIRSSNTLNIGKENASFLLNYSLTHSDGYRENNEYDRHSFSMINNFNYNKKSEVSFLLNYTALKAFIPSSLNEDDYLNEPSKAAFTWNNVNGFEDYSKIQVGLSNTSNWDRWSNTTSIFGTFFDSFESRPFNILNENSRAVGARTKFDYNFDINNTEHLLNIGAEYFNEKYDWQTYKTLNGTLGEHLSDNIETRKYFNIFSEVKWELINNLTLETGVNLNSTKYNLEDRFFLDSIDISGDYSFDLIVSPRIGINYLWREKLISFYGNVSHGFNLPTLEETLTPDGAINPEIQPEKGWSYEIGSKGQKSNINYNASIYYMAIKDLLVAKRLDLDQFQGINAGSTSHFGFELDLNYNKRIKKTFINPFINYHFANYKFKEYIDGDDDYSGNELTGAIPHKINGGIKLRADNGIYGNIIYKFVDGMPMRDDNSIYSDSYNTVDVKFGYNILLGNNEKFISHKWQLDLYFGIRNILNEKYASQILINAGSFGGNAPRYYYPGLPRNYYGGINLKYKW